jgi:tRNA G46 methylase TrmB
MKNQINVSFDLEDDKKIKKHYDEIIEDYLKRMGLPRWSSQKSFQRFLRKNYGTTAERLIQLMDQRVRDTASFKEFYALKNTNLQLSLSISGNVLRNFYRDYLSWWLPQEWQPLERLLDIGCDCGVLTCFYATHYPEAEILGIDKCVPAIDRARELADQLELKNVRFEVMDINNLSILDSDQGFDLITSTLVLDEVVSFSDDRLWSLEDIEWQQEIAPLLPILTSIRGLLKQEGFYVTVDRHPNASYTAKWVRALNRSNLRANWIRSFKLALKSGNVSQENLILLTSEPDNNPTQDPDELLSFLGSAEITKKEEELVLEGEAGELLFRTFKDKDPIFGVEYDHPDGSGSVRIELWQVDAIVLGYMYNTNWYRHVSIHSLFLLPMLIPVALKSAEAVRQDRKFKISRAGRPYEDADLQEESDGSLKIFTKSTIGSPLVIPAFLMKRIS